MAATATQRTVQGDSCLMVGTVTATTYGVWTSELLTLRIMLPAGSCSAQHARIVQCASCGVKRVSNCRRLHGLRRGGLHPVQPAIHRHRQPHRVRVPCWHCNFLTQHSASSRPSAMHAICMWSFLQRPQPVVACAGGGSIWQVTNSRVPHPGALHCCAGG